MINQQLALAIKPNPQATLQDYNWGVNSLLEQHLLQILAFKSDRILFIWGTEGAGKSHLLQACCQELHPHHSSMYLPLNMLQEWGPESLEGLEDHDLLCIDDIDSIAGNTLWEEAIFHLYNKIKDSEKNLLIVTGKCPPAQSSIKLPDLKSRLSWGQVYQLFELDDLHKIHTLKNHALKQGFILNDSVCQFLLNRCSRNMRDLDQILNLLDDASLAAHRKITIPFVKNILKI